RSNQPPRSTSGNRCFRPDLGGHSSSKVLLRSCAGSQSPASAHTCTCLPLGCLKVPRSCSPPLSPGSNPVSSVNSRRAQASSSSPPPTRPFGTDHAPASFLDQKGPPG